MAFGVWRLAFGVGVGVVADGGGGGVVEAGTDDQADLAQTAFLEGNLGLAIAIAVIDHEGRDFAHHDRALGRLVCPVEVLVRLAPAPGRDAAAL